MQQGVQTDATCNMQQRWELLANNVASVYTGLKVWPVSNFAQQHASTFNKMQQGVQTDATCNMQQRWELLANNVASVCMQPKTSFGLIRDGLFTNWKFGFVFDPRLHDLQRSCT